MFLGSNWTILIVSYNLTSGISVHVNIKSIFINSHNTYKDKSVSDGVYYTPPGFKLN